MRISSLATSFLLIWLLGLASAPAVAQVSWVSDARIAESNNGALPATRIHVVMKSTDQPDQLEFHFRALVSAGFEAEVFSLIQPGKRIYRVVGGMNADSFAGEARETQQRVRFKNLHGDSSFILVLKDSATGRIARLKVGQENLLKPFAVYFSDSTSQPSQTIRVKNALVLRGRCEFTCAISEDCSICGYGVIGSCLLNLVTCTVSECDTNC